MSLEYRRLIADLLWCYKIVFNDVDISIDEFVCFITCSYTRRHAYKLYKSRPLTSIGNKSSAVAEISDVAMIDMGRQEGGCCAPFAGGEAASPSNTM